MNQHRPFSLVFIVLLVFGLLGSALAQTPPKSTKSSCGPDHKIIYKRAVTLLDNAEKRLNTGYTAEAKSMVKEAKNLFAILEKECGQDQKLRPLTDKEMQQETYNKKFAADEQAEADRLLKSAQEKEKKSAQIEATQKDLSVQLERQAKSEYEQAEKRSIKSMIYSMRTDQMLFTFLAK
jgi:Tfp pilus assembly protein PilX